MTLERISIELTNRCAKACWFCYASSAPSGGTSWTPDEIVGFVTDCAARGVKAVSFGGGEPLEYSGVFEVLRRLRGTLFRTMTTNGLALDDKATEALADAHPDKVHISIHFPGDAERVITQVHALAARGLRSGINLLVARSQLPAMTAVAARVRAAGIDNDRIVYLPMRIHDTPSPEEVARVAGGPFQSMTCLSACGSSPRFASIAWDRTIAWCSYTRTRRPLAAPTHAALVAALEGLGLEFCGGRDDGTVRLSRRPLDGHDLVRGRP